MFNFRIKKKPVFRCILLTSAILISGCSLSIPQSGLNSQTNDMPEVSQISEFSHSVCIRFITYYGTYNGETQNGLPSGNGVFIATEDNSDKVLFTYSGSFSNGAFDGDGRMDYPDGSHLTGTFQSNIPSGVCTFYRPDQSFYTASYSNGQPYGLVCDYSASEEFLSFDWFYGNERISDLKKLSIQPDYKELYHQAERLKGDVLFLQATVTRIFESKDSCSLLLEDNEHNIYLTTYKNSTHAKSNQAYMPSLNIGDSVSLYGFYSGIHAISYTDSEENEISFGYSYPSIEPFYGEISENPFILDKDVPLSYEQISQNPYLCSQQEISLKGTILAVYEGSKKYIVKCCETKGTNTLTDHIYFTSVKKNPNRIPPAPGDTIKISGTLAGNYKFWNSQDYFVENNSKEYELYPQIRASRITFK